VCFVLAHVGAFPLLLLGYHIRCPTLPQARSLVRYFRPGPLFFLCASLLLDALVAEPFRARPHVFAR
jgi:hypothetical protein